MRSLISGLKIIIFKRERISSKVEAQALLLQDLLNDQAAAFDDVATILRSKEVCVI